MKSETVAAYVGEVNFVRDEECLKMIDSLRRLVSIDTPDAETLRLMCVPMLYSVWERAFSNWTAISLRVVCESYRSAGECPPRSRAFWLRKADFFRSFVDAIRDVVELEREDSIIESSSGFAKKITKGGFQLSAKVLQRLDEWHAKPLVMKGDLSNLVVTYSNVNENVLALNAEAIGLDGMVSYSGLDLSKLGSLVGIRNGIGHGASLSAPGVRELAELIDYTEQLIKQYAAVVIEWIADHLETEDVTPAAS